MSGNKRKIPIEEGMWMTSSIDGRSQLIASQCGKCNEIFFPKKKNGICTHCQTEKLHEIILNTKGKIYNFTVVMQRPPLYYHGDVPYAFGFVELPEGIRIRSHFTGCNFDELKIGMDVELVIEKLGENEDGDEIMTYKFGPIKS